MLLFKRFNAPLLLSSCLLLPLASCANSSLGESLQKAFAADPRLEAKASSNPPTAIDPTPQIQSSSQPTESPSTSPTPFPTANSPDTTSSDTASPNATSSDTASSENNLASIPAFSDSTVIGAIGTANPIDSTTTTGSNNTTSTATSTDPAIDFTDLNQTPQALRQYVADLAKLGVLTPFNTGSKTSQAKASALFDPNKTITRRDYARWLVTVNNHLHASQPAQQIRLGTDSSQPAFQDVPRSDPDFSSIQGLAEAGLIPSALTGDSTIVTFRPDAPLTREQLILWKVPADTRQALPTASIDAVKQTWGFQDAARIDPKALRAVLADYQNGDLSNIRRVFGYTTLFQPKKTVTRAEAAAALWYFGFQGDGQSVQDALKAATVQSR